MSEMTGDALFDAEFLRKLERLELLARKIFRGLIRGEHHTHRRGHGQEFSDFRRYQPGDDLRYVDWNIFSRLDRLFLKLYSSDEDLTLHLIVDCSASMGFGEPRKFDYARRLTAALGYIGLNNLDRVSINGFAKGSSLFAPILKSKPQVASLFAFLQNLRSEHSTGFADAMSEFNKRTKHPGMTVVITDLLDTQQLTMGLERLRNRGHDISLIQVLSEEDITPSLAGSLRLIDVEDESAVKVTVDAGLRQLYQDKLRFRLEAVEAFCAKHRIEYLRASTVIAFDDLILKYLRSTSQWR